MTRTKNIILLVNLEWNGNKDTHLQSPKRSCPGPNEGHGISCFHHELEQCEYDELQAEGNDKD